MCIRDSVALDARLVERINAQQVAADAAGKLKEVEQLAQGVFILLRNIYLQVRYIAVRVGKNCTVHRALIDKVHILSCQIVQDVYKRQI